MATSPPSEAVNAIDHADSDARSLSFDQFILELTKLVERNSFADYIFAAIIAVVVFAVLSVIKIALVRILRRHGGDSTASRRGVLAATAARTSSTYIGLVSLLAGVSVLDVPPPLTLILHVLAGVGFFVQAGIWATALLKGLAERYAALHGDRDPEATTGVPLITMIARIAVWSVVMLLILDNLGVDITTLIAGLGVGGIAIGLAAQNVLGDLFASMTIVMDKPFVRGDFIDLGNGQFGTVERIGLKTTRLRSLSGEEMIVANTALLTNRIHNYKRMWERRLVFQIGVTYQTPHDKLVKVPELIREAVESQKRTRLDRCHFSGYGDSALLFETVWYVSSPDYRVYMDVQQAIYLAIHKAFEVEGIDFAYPTQTVFVEGAGTANGARAGAQDA